MSMNSANALPYATHRTRVCVALVGLLLLGLLTSGCGYTHGKQFSKEFHTVAIPIFENKTFEQGLEFEVTEAIIKEIELRTPYKVVSESSADTIIDGTITRAVRNRLSRDKDSGFIQEYEYVIHVNLEWKNLRTGKTLRSRKDLQSVGRAVPGGFANESDEIGRHTASDRLAGQVVALMRDEW